MHDYHSSYTVYCEYLSVLQIFGIFIYAKSKLPEFGELFVVCVLWSHYGIDTVIVSCLSYIPTGIDSLK